MAEITTYMSPIGITLEKFLTIFERSEFEFRNKTQTRETLAETQSDGANREILQRLTVAYSCLDSAIGITWGKFLAIFERSKFELRNMKTKSKNYGPDPIRW